MPENVMRWHQDGHSFSVLMDKATLIPFNFHCPNRNEADSACHIKGECIVERFVETYGFDCNVGVTEIVGQIEIAWTVVGDVLDIDSCQVWFIPINDEFYSAWSSSQAKPEVVPED